MEAGMLIFTRLLNFEAYAAVAGDAAGAANREVLAAPAVSAWRIFATVETCSCSPIADGKRFQVSAAIAAIVNLEHSSDGMKIVPEVVAAMATLDISSLSARKLQPGNES
ncbi:MAG TPA: hypothetical protein VGR96_04080 [Acidobacteriaceae bacterium]|nr:hypothetical protein [Acidobacteriaceae bacterium]